MEYITSPHGDEKSCIFCFSTDKPHSGSLLLYSGPLSSIIMNRYPYSNGHLLVSPKRHVSTLDGLTTEESYDIMRLIARSTTILASAMNAEGFNTGANLGRAAGAGIEDHLHFHVVPRWQGDANFMTVLSEVRVIPEHIESTYRTLLPHFSGI